MLNEKILQQIKNDYLIQLRRIYGRSDPRLLRNLYNVQATKFVFNKDIGVSANSDIENNIVEYGPNCDECTIYHELDHIRKGTSKHKKTEDIRLNSARECVIYAPRAGIFFDESITEFIAQYMFRESAFYKPHVGDKKLKLRRFYFEELETLQKLANATKKPIIEICKMIDLCHAFGDEKIDNVCKTALGKAFFEIEVQYDFYGTAQFINFQHAMGCMPKLSRESMSKANYIKGYMDVMLRESVQCF